MNPSVNVKLGRLSAKITTKRRRISTNQTALLLVILRVALISSWSLHWIRDSSDSMCTLYLIPICRYQIIYTVLTIASSGLMGHQGHCQPLLILLLISPPTLCPLLTAHCNHWGTLLHLCWTFLGCFLFLVQIVIIICIETWQHSS